LSLSRGLFRLTAAVAIHRRVDPVANNARSVSKRRANPASQFALKQRIFKPLRAGITRGVRSSVGERGLCLHGRELVGRRIVSGDFAQEQRGPGKFRRQRLIGYGGFGPPVGSRLGSIGFPVRRSVGSFGVRLSAFG
jgi:hypothetical protein